MGLSLRKLLTFQLLLGSAFTAAVAAVAGFQPGASFGLGSVIMFANLILLAWVWNRLIEKKAIAWTALIIVIKYTVLLGAIYFLTQAAWFHVLSAGLGMVTFVLTALVQVALTTRE